MANTVNHYPGIRSTHWQPEEVKIINGKPVRFSDIVVHTIKISDIEDPDIIVGSHLWKWQQSEEGQYIMKCAVEPPYWVKHEDYASLSYEYRIVARLSEPDLIIWKLKWS